MNLEKLNLYRKKVKKISIKRFIFLLSISLIPFFSLIFIFQYWLIISISKTMNKYPVVFNDIVFSDPSEIPAIVENRIIVYDEKINNLSRKIKQLKTSLNESFYSKFYLQVLFNEFSNSREYVFVKKIYQKDRKFDVEFYLFSDKNMNYNNVLETIKNYYKNVKMEIIDTKSILHDLNMYDVHFKGEW